MIYEFSTLIFLSVRRSILST